MGSLVLPPVNDVELIFLGTGTSSSLPRIECLTSSPEDKPCYTCLSTLSPKGKKNIRRNTSAALRINGKDGKPVTIVIDVGKTFQAAALEWFPKYGLRRIDAVLITHAHADAMNGLDDLRGWTLNHTIQDYIDVYVSQSTFTEVQRSFPYLISKEFASGGGDVPEFKWHIFEDKVPFEIENTGIQVTPFSVHHGRLFSTSPPPGCVPTPNNTMPSTPNSHSGASTPSHGCSDSDVTVNKVHPYICFGFKIREVVYISDVSHIPDDTWALLARPKEEGPLPVFILDCLRLQPHTSHLGLKESIAITRQMGARRTYLTGFSHEVSHDEYVTVGRAIEGCQVDRANLNETEERALAMVGEGHSAWVRPAHDGLRVFLSVDGEVRDETYD